MAGATPYEAVHRYIEPLQRTASCVTPAVLQYQGKYQAETSYALFLGDGDPIHLKREDMTAPPLYLSFTMWYRVVLASDPGGLWTVTTDGYEYSLDDERGREIIAYHWHPSRGWASFPHLHIEAGCEVGRKEFVGIHLPTERVAFGNVVWVALHELRVEPLRSDWEGVLDAARANVF